VLGSQRSKDLLDHKELVHLRLPCKKRLSVGELTHDAAERPDVNILAIVCRPQEQLGCSVPARGNVVRQGRVSRHRTCKAKVAETERIVRRVD